MSQQRLKLLSANIQAGSSMRRYSDYATRSWSHVLPAGGKRSALDVIAKLASGHDIVGLQESDPGSWRSGWGPAHPWMQPSAASSAASSPPWTSGRGR